MEIQPIENIALIIMVGIGCITIVLIALFLFIRLYQTRMQDKENELLKMESDYRLRLIKSIIEAEEKEKETIAKNLHDEIGTALTILQRNMNVILEENKLDQNEEVKCFDENLNDIILNIRSVCRDLLPNDLKLFGLNKSLEQFCNNTSKQTQLSITFKSDYNDEVPSEKLHIIIYRLFKELMSNIIKHSSTTGISTEIIQTDRIQIIFTYNGKGVSNEEIEQIKTTNSGIGLSSIDSRLIIINGNINYLPDVASQKNKITLSISNNEL